MNASEIRLNARKSLKDKWGKAALMTLSYVLFLFMIHFILNLIPVVGYIIYIIISIPLSYGFTASFINLKRYNETKVVSFTTEGFGQFSKTWAVSLKILLKCIIPIILLIIPLGIIIYSTATSSENVARIIMASEEAIINSIPTVALVISIILIIISYIWLIYISLSYSLCNYILKDNPDMTSKEIVKESAKLMKGNRLKLVWLELTFIGWDILSVLTLGIGLFWLNPYIEFSIIEFYEQLLGKQNNTVNIEELNPIN